MWPLEEWPTLPVFNNKSILTLTEKLSWQIFNKIFKKCIKPKVPNLKNLMTIFSKTAQEAMQNKSFSQTVKTQKLQKFLTKAQKFWSSYSNFMQFETSTRDSTRYIKCQMTSTKQKLNPHYHTRPRKLLQLHMSTGSYRYSENMNNEYQ